MPYRSRSDFSTLKISHILIHHCQNEPQNSNPTYPTCTMTPDMEGQIGSSLRSLLNSNGLSNVKIIGYEVDLSFPFTSLPPITKSSTTGTMQEPIRHS